jgi:hypothetical protein
LIVNGRLVKDGGGYLLTYPELYASALAARGFNPLGLYRSVTADGRPVLCATCHASEALHEHAQRDANQLARERLPPAPTALVAGVAGGPPRVRVRPAGFRASVRARSSGIR